MLPNDDSISNQNKYPSSHYRGFGGVYSTTSWICFVLGSMLNGLLIWLVMKKSPRELKAYNCILVQTCVVDLFALILSVMVQPIYIMLEGSNLMLQNGLFRSTTQPVNFIMAELWVLGYYFSIVSIVIQFIYRYLTVCRNVTVTPIIHMTMLFAGAFIVSGYNGLLYFAMYPRHELSETMNQSIRQFFDYGFPEDEYIQVSMIGQPATLPLLAVLIGVFCVFVCTTAITIGSLFSLYFISFLTVPVPWIPVINPLITLMIVRPYRNFMLFDRGHRQIDVSMTGSRTPRNLSSINAHPRRPISAYKAQMSGTNSKVPSINVN
ncbi:serpentine type 7TM GPCR chemoreceptor str domain-containing protein [Ditylenchus destructor]|nr:serpentine type 7TM GPCR chemoreceptor str domain-containing protein [Ditylenchus destructor]